MKGLIVNADDFGITEARSRGITHGANIGCISSATVIVNGLASKILPQLLLESKSKLEFGIHINLTEGTPISNISKVPSLVNESGEMLGKFGFREKLQSGDLNLEHAKIEVIAQIRYFIELFGKKPTHFDSHQHIHVLPQIAPLIAEIVTQEEFLLFKTRIPFENFSLYPWKDEIPARLFYETISSQANDSRIIYESKGIAAPLFAGNFHFGMNNSLSRFKEILQSLQEGQTLEFMCHPGYASNEWDNFNNSSDREYELNLFTNQSLLDEINSMNVKLISFSNWNPL